MLKLAIGQISAGLISEAVMALAKKMQSSERGGAIREGEDEDEETVILREVRDSEAQRIAILREINHKEAELITFFRQVRDNEDELVALFKQVRDNEEERLMRLREISNRLDEAESRHQQTMLLRGAVADLVRQGFEEQSSSDLQAIVSKGIRITGRKRILVEIDEQGRIRHEKL